MPSLPPHHLTCGSASGGSGQINEGDVHVWNLPACLRNAVRSIVTSITDAGVMFEAVMNLNCELNGLLMLGDSLFDRDATPLAGSACEG